MPTDQPALVISATHLSPDQHPFLLFSDITKTPGYIHHTQSPWKDWESEVISSANEALSKDFSSRRIGSGSDNYVAKRGLYAQDLALAYQITKKPAYADKAKEALMNIGVGDIPSDPGFMSPEGIQAISLLGYCLAYDWVQPTLDPDSDKAIRDKLAKLADTCYKKIQENPEFISYADWHGQAYPILGIAGVVLYDYTNPNGISLYSGPDEWRRVGTDYLFVNDKLHSFNRPLVDFEIDPQGKDMLGAYINYYMDDFAWWAQIYTRFYGKNFFDVYPAAKKLMINEIWESLPNYYSNNFVTNGNVKWNYPKGIINLLDSANQSYVLNHIDHIEKSSVLPYSRYMQPPFNNEEMPESLLYLVFDDYSSVPRVSPPFLSVLSNDSVFQVFRGSWSEDSDWLSLITFGKNVPTHSYRNTQHHDQMSFEYYSRGDLLLADAGEDRKSTDNYKGEYEVHHNTIAIENPRNPFSKAKWSGSVARGMFKGDVDGLSTIANVRSIVQVPWLEMEAVNTSISKVIGSSASSSQSLSSPIAYERQVLYPEKDYFIVIDRMVGTETWNYRNIFRPATLNIDPTNGDNIGHVSGDLSFGGDPYDWLSNSYKKEYSTGINTSSFEWSVTSPYGKAVKLQVYTVPSSDTLVMKQIGRIGGYDEANEVYSPVVYFRTDPAKELYRATVLLSRYSTESAKTPSTVSVSGVGNALKVSGNGYEDYVYTGKGASSFASFATDANTVFVRMAGQPKEYTIIRGSSLDYEGKPLVSASETVDYLTLKDEGQKITLKAACSEVFELMLTAQDPSTSYQVNMDGAPYAARSYDGLITMTVGPGEHTIEIYKQATSTPAQSKICFVPFLNL